LFKQLVLLPDGFKKEFEQWLSFLLGIFVDVLLQGGEDGGKTHPTLPFDLNVHSITLFLLSFKKGDYLLLIAYELGSVNH
jgi:hypothetical protein